MKPYDLDTVATVAATLLSTNPDVKSGNYSNEHQHIVDSVEAAIILMDECVKQLGVSVGEASPKMTIQDA